MRLTPPRAALVRRLGPATSLTLATWLEGGSWNIDDDGRPVDFSHRAIRAGLGLTAPIGSRFDLTLWAGANLLQEIELQDEDGDTLFESDVHESPFVSCALRVLDW